MEANSIKNKNDIQRIKNYFISQNSFTYDRHLLYFTLGINTCLKPDELSKLTWDQLFENNHIKDFFEYNSYKFYLNINCKNTILEFVEKYKINLEDKYIFSGIGRNQGNMTYAATNKMYRIIQDKLSLDFNFSNLSLHKTFVYWQIYYNHRDYIKMSKLRYMTSRNAKSKMDNDINVYADYQIYNDMIYINDVNL